MHQPTRRRREYNIREVNLIRDTRQAICGTAWRHVGLNAKTTRRPVLIPECHIYESKLFEDSLFDDQWRHRPVLRDVALNTVQLARADFFFGGVGDGTAHDLGDGFWYVFHEDPAVDTWLLAIVPSTCAGEGFRDAQCQWLREVYTDVLPTSLTAHGMNEPWFIRRLVELAAP